MLPGFPSRFKRTIRQAAQTLRGRRPGRDPRDVVAEAFHKGRGFVVVGVFELGEVWFEL